MADDVTPRHSEVRHDGIDFGEGPRWHEGRLWFSDFYRRGVLSWHPDDGERTELALDGQPSGLGWLPDGRLLVVDMLDRRVLRREADGTLVIHGDLSAIATGPANDMVVDGTGRAWVGNFGFDLFAGEQSGPADLAVVHPDGRVEVAATGLMFPNGSVVTPDGSMLVVGESFGQRYRAWTIASDGSLVDERVRAETPGMAPDGCCLDAAGGIWFANARGAECVRVTEGGTVTDRVATSQHAYACMLGGDAGTTLHVLTSPSSDPDEVAGAGRGRIETVEVDHPRAGWP